MIKITFAYHCPYCKKEIYESRKIEEWKKEWSLDVYYGGIIDLDGVTISNCIGKICDCKKSPGRGEYMKGFLFAVITKDYIREDLTNIISFYSICKNCSNDRYGKIEDIVCPDVKEVDLNGVVNSRFSLKDYVKYKRSISFLKGKCQCEYSHWDPHILKGVIHRDIMG
jgi:hypothetical protein